MPAKTVIDIEGSEAVSKVLLVLLNDFPGLSEDEVITFSSLDEESGIGFFPVSGAAIENERETITGHVKQRCLYPFNITYRAAPRSDTQRMRIKEFLDALGKWLERHVVTLNGEEHRIEEYPILSSGNRKIKVISRSTPAYLMLAYASGVEDWNISMSLTYENEFIR